MDNGERERWSKTHWEFMRYIRGELGELKIEAPREGGGEERGARRRQGESRRTEGNGTMERGVAGESVVTLSFRREFTSSPLACLA